MRSVQIENGKVKNIAEGRVADWLQVEDDVDVRRGDDYDGTNFTRQAPEHSRIELPTISDIEVLAEVLTGLCRANSEHFTEEGAARVVQSLSNIIPTQPAE